MSRVKRRILLIVAGLVVAGGLLGVAGQFFAGRPGAAAPVTAAPGDKPGVAVTVEPVALRSVRRSVNVTGSLYGRDEVSLTPKVEGRIVKIYHDVGDIVKPGEPLLDIDPTDYQLAVLEARRGLQLELAKLGLKELPAEKLDLGSLPSVVRAAAQERNAGIRRDRLRRLSTTSVVSQEERDTSETDAAVASAGYRQAILEAEVTLATAQYRQAVLDTAQQRLKDTRVLVPSPSVERPADPAARG
jgi:multidrug efflux pump subunit AcrA (membrane-fusion protein)